jgi:Putative Actinobacterial Holin-X, holin superfamily III
MEKSFAKAEELAGNVKDYIHTSIELVKLQAAEKASAVVAGMLEKLVMAVFLLFFIGLASIALAVFLGDLTGKNWAGFLIVAGIYLLIGGILWTARKKIIRVPLMNAFIYQLFNKDADEAN